MWWCARASTLNIFDYSLHLVRRHFHIFDSSISRYTATIMLLGFRCLQRPALRRLAACICHAKAGSGRACPGLHNTPLYRFRDHCSLARWASMVRLFSQSGLHNFSIKPLSLVMSVPWYWASDSTYWSLSCIAATMYRRQLGQPRLRTSCT